MSENFAEDIHGDLVAGQVLELAELYALNALSDQERTEIDHFLATSAASVQADFADRLRQARETLAVAYGNVEEEPPSSLFDRISKQISADENVSTSETDDLAARREARAEATKRNRHPVRRWIIGAAAAAAVVVAASVGINGFIGAQNSPTDQVITAADVRVATVPVQGGGDAKVSVSTAKDSAVVQMSGVPAPGPGTVYQLWLLPQGTDQAPVSLGLMASSTDLGKPALVTGISTAQALAITVEPTGGSEKPTSLPVMFSKFDA